MLRRLRRPLTLLASALLMSGLVASCGSQTTADPLGPTTDGLGAVSISGDVGSVPEVTWKTQMSASTPQVTTLTTGAGAALKAGDSVMVNYWLGDGYTQKSAVFNTFGPATAGFQLTVGQAPAQPASIDDLVAAFISTQVKPGVTEDSRLAITVSSDNMFGQNVMSTPVLQKDIGNQDALLVVVDVEKKVLAAPEGAQQPLPAWAPKITLSKGKPSALNFAGVPALGSALKVGILKKGTGDLVKKGDEIVVNYLGQVYQGAKPFDESFSKAPFPTAIGLGKVVKGWDQGLVGLPVGSRVMLGIPPALGYGAKGQGSTIPGNSTLYFVIDILGAA